MGRLTDLPNIGKEIARQLRSVGTELREALQNIKKSDLAPERKAALRAFYEAQKK